MEETVLSPEQIEALTKHLVEKIDKMFEDSEEEATKEEEHDPILCGEMNALLLGAMTVTNLIDHANKHYDHPHFVWHVLDFVSSIEPDLTSLRSQIMMKVRNDHGF